MKKRYLILAILAFFGYSLNALAVSSPVVGTIPASVDADTYTITVYCDTGATVTVVGGPSDLAPVTDGQGADALDGEVRIQVALAQNAVNTFSITAQKGTDVSNAVLIEINEVSEAGGVPPPSAPALQPIPTSVATMTYKVTGYTESEANIYARNTAGQTVGSTQADAEGYFEVTVPLEANKTNRINISAENEAGGEGKAAQAVIRQVSTGTVETEEETQPTPEPVIAAPQAVFNDIQGHWAEDYINQLYELEVVSGKSEGIFDPDGLITRAELTKIAILAFGHSVNTSVSEAPFGDVPANAWFAPYVEEGKRLGFVSGYDGGGFGPNDFVTRAAALKILLGAAGIDATGMIPDFPDVSADAWFAPYVGFAQQKEIVGGYANGTFGPANNMTRAQVAKVVIKIIESLN